MPTINHTQSGAQKRKLRVRSKLFGTAERPRLTIDRSNKHTYLQVINDEVGKTIASASDLQNTGKQTKTQRAEAAAQKVADQLSALGVKKVVIDRGSYRYHGRIRAVTETIRAAGVEV